MQKDKPLVSVVITNYNYGRYIKEALDSVLAQTYKNIELIVIDDGSTDNSVEIIDEYKNAHPETNVLKQKNGGVVAARNKALDLINGEFLVFLDSDDRLPPNYIEALVRQAQDQNADVIYTDLQRFGDEDVVIEYPEFSLDAMKASNIAHASSLLRTNKIKKQRFDEYLNKRSHEDWDFLLGLALSGARFAKSKETMLDYRAHGQSRSTSAPSTDDLNCQAYDFVTTSLYIIDKYKKIYPGKIDITPNSEFITWWGLAQKRLDLIRRFQKDQKEKEKIIESNRREMIKMNQAKKKIEKELALILSSKKYKIGEIILKPFSVTKSALKKKE